MKKSLFVLLCLFLSSCARTIHVNYVGNEVGTNTIHFSPNRATSNTSVAIDSKIYVDNENVDAVYIHNVPNGKYDVSYSSSDSRYKYPLYEEDIVVLDKDFDQQALKIIVVPPFSAGYWLYLAILAAVPLIL